MSDNKKKILTKIVGLADINSTSGRNRLIYNFNDIDIKFQEYKEDCNPEELKDVYECYRDVSNLYRTIIMNTTNEFFDNVYGQSADYVLINYPQENISLKLEKYLNEKGIPQQFKSDIYSNIKILAERLNKRFTFNEMDLIHMIEASSGKNIITEDTSLSREHKILSQVDGKYEYVDSENKKIFTHNGKSTANREVDSSSFPMGNKFIQTNTNDALKKVIGILIENLNLCIETYMAIYTSGNSEIANTAKCSDGTTFDFVIKLSDYNIPHLLGIPRASQLDDSAIEHLNLICGNDGRNITRNSSALDVLLKIYYNQNSILRCYGLYEDHGKLYQLINWEKVILKTTSFMRGDFFKTCFCLAQISPNRYLASSDRMGGYTSISSTEYSKGLQTTKNVRSVLNDLLKTRKQKKDFIFRGIYPEADNKNYMYTIMTGKAETIRVGETNELLHSLQRYRNLFADPNGGIETEQTSIKPVGNGTRFERVVSSDELFALMVEEIENEKFIRIFTPEEQAELGISISRDLSLVPHLSLEAMDVLQDVHNYNGAVTSTELDEFDNARSNSNKLKK